MNGFKIYFLGLFNFFARSSGRLVLVPDGRTPDGNIAPHYASFYLETDKTDASGWWPMKPQSQELKDIGVGEFPINEPCTITISGVGDNSGCWPIRAKCDVKQHEKYVFKLPKIDPAIRIVPEKADTIAQIPIRRGTLEIFLFIQQSMVTQLSMPKYEGSITITAETDRGQIVKTLVIKAGTDIVLSNTSDPFADHTGEDSHFKLYGLLDVHRKSDKLYEPPVPNIGNLEYTHPYLILLGQFGQFPPPNCSNSGG